MAVPDRIAGAAARIELNNLMMVAETVRLRDALAAEGIDALFVKGLPLAMAAYGTTRLKMSLDIDVLVALDSIDAACAVLTRLGYVRQAPDASVPPEGVRTWVAYFKETSWVHPERRVTIDLHARLVNNARLIPDIGLASPRATIEIAPGTGVATLSRDPLFVYLCVHGAASGWSRLKWIADLAALANDYGPDELARLHRVAASFGVERCAAQGLLLGVDLLGLGLGDLEAALRRARVNLLMVRMALTSITGRYETAPHRHHSLGGIPILASHFLMRAGLGHKFSELTEKLANPRDRAHARLPARLAFLYPALGIARWLTKRLRSWMLPKA